MRPSSYDTNLDYAKQYLDALTKTVSALPTPGPFPPKDQLLFDMLSMSIIAGIGTSGKITPARFIQMMDAIFQIVCGDVPAAANLFTLFSQLISGLTHCPGQPIVGTDGTNMTFDFPPNVRYFPNGNPSVGIAADPDLETCYLALGDAFNLFHLKNQGTSTVSPDSLQPLIDAVKAIIAQLNMQSADGTVNDEP